MQYSLTVAIPTYNRIKDLKFTLPITLGICEGRNIEILVSDNASTDGTREYMLAMTEKHPQLVYYRNHENLGPDRNFLNCFERAQGEYIYLLGDDDLLLEEGFALLMEALRLSPVFIHLNTSGLIERKDGTYVCGQPRCEEKGLEVYTDKNELLKSMGIYLTFMSSLVFRNEYVRMIQDKEQYIGSFFIQSHIALRTMEHEGIYILNTLNCCAEKGNRTVNYDLFHVWGRRFGDLMFQTAVESGFDRLLVREIAHEAYAATILDFVWNFRGTCMNEKQWDRSELWFYVEKFPDLACKYRWAVNCPRRLLPLRKIPVLLGRMWRKFKKILRGDRHKQK